MPDLTAKRTLVKSPPELWEELSEVDRLAKHLGAFGEITITKLEPEHTVAWEGERASGTVSIEPSGWGTKVTLRADLPDPAEPEPPGPGGDRTEAQHVADQIRPYRVEPDAELEPDATKSSTEGGPEAEVDEEPGLGSEPGPVAGREADADAETPEPRPRRGFWGWLFRTRTGPVTQDPKPVAAEAEPVGAGPQQEPVVAEPDSEPVVAEPDSEPVRAGPQPVVAEAEPVAAGPQPEPAAAEPDSEPVRAGPQPEPAAAEPEPVETEVLNPERARVILDEALDALGAAHHRPFSRG